MSMSPSSGKASMKSSFRPLMLRKWTLKILPRSPNQRIPREEISGRVVEHLGHRALAEIEPVIGALVHLDKALQPLDGAEHAGVTAVAGRRVGVVRMAGEPHLGRGRDRDDGGEKMVDPLPILRF